jgi:hypothetical protein
MGTERLEDALLALRSRYDPTVVDRDIIYYLSLGESPDEKWTVTLTPSSCSLLRGRVGDAHCVLKTRADLFVRLIHGSYQPGPADFALGRIKTNDIGLLLKLRKAFAF